MNDYSTPFTFTKGTMEAHFSNILAPPDETIFKCLKELSEVVDKEERRLGHAISFEIKDIIRAEGKGFSALGYYNPREWQLYNFFEAMPEVYAWLLSLYRKFSFLPENIAQCNKALFFMSLPIQVKNNKMFYRARLQSWFSDIQKPENKPRIMLTTMDLMDSWSMEEPPIKAIGEFGNPSFPGSLDDFNNRMKTWVSQEFFSNPKYLGLSHTELKTLYYLYKNDTIREIAQKMKTNGNNINAHNRKIKAACNKRFGQLKEARQWANFLGQVFDLEVLDNKRQIHI